MYINTDTGCHVTLEALMENHWFIVMITLWIHYVSGCLLQTAKVSYSKRYIYVGRIGEVVLDLQCIWNTFSIWNIHMVMWFQLLDSVLTCQPGLCQPVLTNPHSHKLDDVWMLYTINITPFCYLPSGIWCKAVNVHWVFHWKWLMTQRIIFCS